MDETLSECLFAMQDAVEKLKVRVDNQTTIETEETTHSSQSSRDTTVVAQKRKRAKRASPHVAVTSRYEDLPEAVKIFFDDRVEIRKRPGCYVLSPQDKYHSVYQQSGSKGYQNVFQVQVCLRNPEGTNRILRLGRCTDSRMGAFMSCAFAADECLSNTDDASSAVLDIVRRLVTNEDEFASRWICGLKGDLNPIGRGFKRRSM